MKISQRFNMNRTQFELDFIDIDITRDTPLFLDPYFIGSRTDPFSVDANRTLNSFFQHFLDLMQSGQEEDARALFDYLHEPNETCLGLSKGSPNGNGIGNINADAIFASVRESHALQSGLLEHLEDFRLFIPDVDKDKVSDMTTNIIRKHLLTYTRQQCQLWNIPLTEGVATGFYWDRPNRVWTATHEPMLVVDNRKLLLVPKGIVSFTSRYTAQQYHQHFVLSFLQNDHLRRQTGLVQRRRSKKFGERQFVTKKSLIESESPLEKDYLSRFTETNHEVFSNFRTSSRLAQAPIQDSQLVPINGLPAVVDRLITTLEATPTGHQNAHRYHRTAAAILELVFYPRLICPIIEREINEGRKRIDLSFDTAAQDGFFDRLSRLHHVNCQYTLVECKNYGQEIGNPEVDQLIGRFHPNRGRFGFLVCRSIADFPLLMARCRDAHQANQGTIIPLTDMDLRQMLNERLAGDAAPGEALLGDRLRDIALR